jgi:hypothetical protein
MINIVDFLLDCIYIGKYYSKYYNLISLLILLSGFLGWSRKEFGVKRDYSKYDYSLVKWRPKCCGVDSYSINRQEYHPRSHLGIIA